MLGEVPRGPALAVAGIANPQGFFEAIRAAGCTVAGEMPFADHHPYSREDLIRISDRARSSGAAAIVTTEKDLVRLLPLRPFPVPIVAAAMALEIDDAVALDAWLAGRIERVRA
jgi:tetraacyldisaccharide 4'-kinase